MDHISQIANISNYTSGKFENPEVNWQWSGPERAKREIMSLRKNGGLQLINLHDEHEERWWTSEKNIAIWPYLLSLP